MPLKAPIIPDDFVIPDDGGGILRVGVGKDGITIIGEKEKCTLKWEWVRDQMWEHYEPVGPGHCPLCGAY